MKKIRNIAKVILYPIYWIYIRCIYEYAKRNPQKRANKLYKKKFGREINWNNPSEFNEKIRWIQFNTDTSKWTLLADKYKVREYLNSKGYSDILVKLYGKWDNAQDINFDLLPESFVIKTNHGCGEVVVVKDKSEINLEKLRKKMQKYLDTPFGIFSAEPHYLKIKPCIIAEELLEHDEILSNSLIDYKFYCIHGQPETCGVFYDRDLLSHKNGMTPYDMEWNKHEEWRRNDIKTPFKDIPKPKTFDKMKRVCEDLSNQFPFVRIDLYEANDKLYFGEFTFTPAALTGGSLDKDLYKKWADKIKL